MTSDIHTSFHDYLKSKFPKLWEISHSEFAICTIHSEKTGDFTFVDFRKETTIATDIRLEILALWSKFCKGSI